MSRQIDLTKELSDEDRQYLVDRARHEDLRMNAEYLGDEAAPLEKIDEGNTGDIDPFTRDDGSDLLPGTHPGEQVTTAVQAAEVGRPEDAPGHVAPGSSEVVVYDDDYEDEDEDGGAVWLKSDLEEECEKRGLSKSGNKSELVARLRANDAEDKEASLEEDDKSE